MPKGSRATRRPGRKVGSGNSPESADGVIRISFTVDRDIRRKIRIASAHADLEVGEWISAVIEAAADKAIEG